MSSVSQIISEIKKVAIYYPSWRIGITNDPNRRKQEHGDPMRWYQWYAVTETSARNVEKYFLDKYMKRVGGGGISPNHVYIFYVGQ
jgi:hypothetical protein